MAKVKTGWSREFLVRWKFNLFTLMQSLRKHSPEHDEEYPTGHTFDGKDYFYEHPRKKGTLKRSWRLSKQTGVSVNAKGDGVTIRNTVDGVAWLQNVGYEVNEFDMPDMPNVYGHPMMMSWQGFFRHRDGFKVDKHVGYVQDAVREFFFKEKGYKVSWGRHIRAPLGFEK